MSEFLMVNPEFWRLVSQRMPQTPEEYDRAVREVAKSHPELFVKVVNVGCDDA